MYIVLVGPSGKCRKGTSLNQGMPFLTRMGIKLSAESITREALIRELKTANESHIDTTTGSIFLHSSLTIFSQELTVFLGYNNQQLMSDLCDWFDCRDSWTYRTKNMGTDEITGVWVNLIGATTPELLQTTLPRDAIGGGLTSRMIFIYESEKSKTVLFPFLGEAEMKMEVDLAFDLEQIAGLSGEFKLGEDLFPAWAKWYGGEASTPPFDDHRFGGYFERRPLHLLKLSTILSASRSNECIVRAEDFERAKMILFDIEKRMPAAFSGVGRNPSGEGITSVLSLLAVNGPMPLAEIQRRLRHDLDAWGLEKVIQTLLSMEAIGRVTDGSGKVTIRATDAGLKMVQGA